MSLGKIGSILGIKSLSLIIVFRVSADCKAITFCSPVKVKLEIRNSITFKKAG